jgi:hypothetical protein
VGEAPVEGSQTDVQSTTGDSMDVDQVEEPISEPSGTAPQDQQQPPVGAGQAPPAGPQTQQQPPADETMDGVQQYCEADTRELNVAQSEAVMKLSPELYLEDIPFDGFDTEEVYTRPFAEVHRLRGTDLPIMGDNLAKRQRQSVLVGFPARELLLGTGLERSLEDAEARELANPQQQQQQQPKGKGKKGKQPQGQQMQPQKKVWHADTVKMALHLDTQAPTIEFTVRVNEEDDTVMSTRIFASDLDILDQDEPEVYFHAGIETDFDSSHYTEQSGGDTIPILEKMSRMKKTAIWSLNLRLVEDRPLRTWENISDDDLRTIRAAEKPTSVRDRLVQELDEAEEIRVYFFVSPPAWKSVEKVVDYATTLFNVANYFGNFWFYSHQTQLEGYGEEAISEIAFPSMDFAKPRWMVTRWSFNKETSSNGDVSYSNATPLSWASFRIPPGLNDQDAAFAVKLATMEERDCQIARLKALVQTVPNDPEPKFFQGTFRALTKDSRCFHVGVYLGVDKQNKMHTQKINMPAVNTRIILAVAKPVFVELSGQVVYDYDQTDASFVCVVNTRNAKPRSFDGSYEILVTYVDDSVPHQREMKAIQAVQSNGDVENGPDVRRMILKCQSTATNPGSLALGTSDEDKAIALKAIDEASPPPDADQAKAIKDTIESKSGITVVVGPPGTGKTNTLTVVADAHRRIKGRKVLVTAPQNSAVQTLHREWERLVNALPAGQRYDESQYVIFNGAYYRMAAAKNLRERQLMPEEELEQETAEWLAAVEKNAPNYKDTVGFKLAQIMSDWADGKKLEHISSEAARKDAQTLAAQWFQAEEAFRRESDAHERQDIRKSLINLEYNLALLYLKHHVKVMFCTFSSAAHELAIESGPWDELICDEAAHDTLAGICTVLGAQLGNFQHVTFGGDHKQILGVAMSQGQNILYNTYIRSVFADFVKEGELQDKSYTPDRPTASHVFMLKTCYRMPQELIAWSSKHCYGDMVRSARGTVDYKKPLANSHKAFFAQRLRNDHNNRAANHRQIAFDVTDIGIASEEVGHTKTQKNDEEARVIADTIREMLRWDPPPNGNTANQQYTRFLGENFLVVTPYSGQVSQIIKELAKADDATMKAQLMKVRVMTTDNVEGDQGDIVFFSTVKATGKKFLAAGERLPLSFTAQLNRFNVSITRQRVARHVVGALQLFANAVVDKHKITQDLKHFFGFVLQLRQTEVVVSLPEWNHALQTRTKPGDGIPSFEDLIQEKATWDQGVIPKAAPTTSSLLLGVNSQSGGLTNLQAAAQGRPTPPENMTFGSNKSKLDARKQKRKAPNNKGGKKGGSGHHPPPAGGSGGAAAAA